MLFMIMQTLSEPSAEGMLGNLFEQYGPMGIGLGVLLYLIMRMNKASQVRIENLEKQQLDQYKTHLDDQKEMIGQYVELVKSKTKILADLTGCLNAIKDTLERMERKHE